MTDREPRYVAVRGLDARFVAQFAENVVERIRRVWVGVRREPDVVGVVVLRPCFAFVKPTVEVSGYIFAETDLPVLASIR